MAGRSNENYLAAIEFEFDHDRAAVLGRYGRMVEVAIARCETLLEDLDEGDPKAVEAYKAGRRVDLLAIDDFCFQREMLRLLDHARVHEFYRVPPPLRDRGGPSIVGSTSRGEQPAN